MQPSTQQQPDKGASRKDPGASAQSAQRPDPRNGDVEDDASAPKKRSLIAIAGSLLAEISLPKLFVAWTIMIIVPGLLLGLSPLIATAWFTAFSSRLGALAGIGPFVILAVVVAVGWFGGRPVFRAVEKSFWSLNSLAVQPGYAISREGLRHLAEHFLMRHASDEGRARLRAATAAGAGVVCCAFALAFVALAWPFTRWTGGVSDLADPVRLLVPAFANTVVLIGCFLAVASLVWGIADGTMDQPRDLERFDPPPEDDRQWRVVHLSDIHVVGERYGFRIESGRAGPRGNDRLAKVLDRLDAIHAAKPLDMVLITGDITDAGRSAEWAEFLDLLALHPALAERTLILPGNHDLNIVDRANPARLDLPTSPGKRLRQIRTLSGMLAVQGKRVRVLTQARDRLGANLSEAVVPHAADIEAFSDAGSLKLSVRLAQVWADIFPLVLPPPTRDGLGVIILNSNAETHFSFTNALGLVSTEQARGLATAMREFPAARWIVALHHHLVEYPKPAHAFSERIGTALINGSWFARQLIPAGRRLVVMHGHRHIDWIGVCGPLRIVSAPSPVMEGTDDKATCFYIHSLAPAPDGGLALLEPELIEITADG
jgi:hypothetical protein